MVSEPVSQQDATLLCATGRRTQLQIGALCRFRGEPLRDDTGQPRLAELRDHVAGRLDLIPRFRKRIRGAPGGMSRPVWVDDERFDIGRHVRSATLPPPGGTEELRAFVAGLLSTPLDLEHPLWDMWLIDGLDDGEMALVLRVHHVVADGLSLVHAALALLDLEPGPPQTAAAPAWRPGPEPGPLTVAARGLWDRGAGQLRLGASLLRGLADPRGLLGAAGATLRTVTSPPRVAPRLPLTGRVGTRRDFSWATLPLAALQELARACEVTLNDVVLAAVTGALRRVVTPGTVEGAQDHPPKVLVPVGDTTQGAEGNAFSFLVTDLPLHLEDPRAVLDQVHRDMVERKASAQSREMHTLFSVIDVLPVPLLERLVPELLARQPFVNLAVTNVPGSAAPLYLLGSELLELAPIITGVGNIACIIGVLSYREQLGVGITVDPDVFAAGPALLAALLDSTRELLAAH